MKPVCRLLVASAFALVLAYPLSLSAQWSKKPYTEWSEKEAMKLLNDSPWGQTHTFTDMSKSFSTGPGSNPTARTTPSADASVRNVHLRVRFLSARPVREAFARMIELNQKSKISEQFAAQLKAFVALGFNDYVVVTLDCDSAESKAELQQVQALLNNRTTADLKNNTYLQSGVQRVFLEEYQTPKSDGLGARLVFPRLVDGKPWLTTENVDIHFYSELSSTYKVDTRYKVKDMIYQGKLEY
jgi:hypothetical protein